MPTPRARRNRRRGTRLCPGRLAGKKKEKASKRGERDRSSQTTEGQFGEARAGASDPSFGPAPLAGSLSDHRPQTDTHPTVSVSLVHHAYRPALACSRLPRLRVLPNTLVDCGLLPHRMPMDCSCLVLLRLSIHSSYYTLAVSRGHSKKGTSRLSDAKDGSDPRRQQVVYH